MTSVQYQKLKKFMQDSNFTHSDEWLTACFSWIKDNYTPAEITDAFLQEQIFEQWLTSDLEEMESKTLPANLEQTKCTVLKGRFALQVNKLQDIGDSSYKQYNKLKKTDLENDGVEAKDSNQYKPSWEPKTRRCLWLSMTDGSQNVFGLEMNMISTLSLAVKPGAKVLIIGPVECRRGVLQLKQFNVKFLGGEVEHLAVTNSVENVLARILNQSENPSASDNVITSSQLNRLTTSTSSTNSTQVTQNLNGNFGEFPDDNFDVAAAGDGFSDDDIFMDIDEGALIASAMNRSNETAEIMPHLAEETTQPILNSFYHPNSVSRNATQNSTVSIDQSFPSSSDTESTVDTSTTQVPLRSKLFVPPASNVTSQNKKPQVKKTTKTLSVKEKSGSTSSKSSGLKNVKSETSKQLKIERYLKPMPVIIDPPTPEREARKLAKKLKTESTSNINCNKESVSFNSNSKSSNVQVAVVDPISGTTNVNDEETQFINEDSDDSLMDLLVESAILADQLEPVQQNENQILGSLKSTDSPAVVVSKHPYIFLKQIHENWDTLIDTRRVLHVKACVATLLSNIRVESGKWTLDVCINDGSQFLNCAVSSDLLKEMIGFAPSEMKQLKKVPDGKEKIARSIKQLTATLIHWNGIFGIEVGHKPLVVSYSEVMLHHIAALTERLPDL